MYQKSANTNAPTPLFDLVPRCPVSRCSPLLHGLAFRSRDFSAPSYAKLYAPCDHHCRFIVCYCSWSVSNHRQLKGQ